MVPVEESSTEGQSASVQVIPQVSKIIPPNFTKIWSLPMKYVFSCILQSQPQEFESEASVPSDNPKTDQGPR